MNLSGIDSTVWYSAKKASGEVAAKLRETNQEENYDLREAVYIEHRKELIYEFKEGKRISSICKGFWKDPRHLASLFSAMTRGAPPLNSNVTENLQNQLGHLELVLRDQVTTVDFQDHLENILKICHIENNGSTTLKVIHILVIFICLIIVLISLLHRRCEFIRLEEDGPPNVSSPHIYAVKVNK